jgi:hypothetical protein
MRAEPGYFIAMSPGLAPKPWRMACEAVLQAAFLRGQYNGMLGNFRQR